MTAFAYCPVRLTEGREWLDASAIGVIRACCQDSIALIARTTPQWHNDNPVVRIVKVRLTEEKE